MFSRLTTRTLILTFAFAGSAACTAILPPDEKDDGVERCDNVEDCGDLGDNRLLASCYRDDSAPDNAAGVCVADYEQINCNPMNYATNTGDPHPFPEAVDMADSGAYSGLCATNGERGCPPESGACAAGLEVVTRTIGDRDVTYCDDPNAAIKAFPPNPDLVAYDLQDQFCKWYFNDERFVCDLSDGRSTCVICDANRGASQGGCYEMWIQGDKSPVYTCPGGSCNDGSKSSRDFSYGSLPEALP